MPTSWPGTSKHVTTTFIDPTYLVAPIDLEINKEISEAAADDPGQSGKPLQKVYMSVAKG